MKTLAQIRHELAAGQFDFSRHAFRRAVERNISEHEIRTAGGRAEIIEGLPGRQVFAERATIWRHVGWSSVVHSGIDSRLGFGKGCYVVRARRPSGPSSGNGGSHADVQMPRLRR